MPTLLPESGRTSASLLSLSSALAPGFLAVGDSALVPMFGVLASACLARRDVNTQPRGTGAGRHTVWAACPPRPRRADILVCRLRRLSSRHSVGSGLESPRNRQAGKPALRQRDQAHTSQGL